MKEKVRGIIRRATRDEKLNVLVIGATHERYEQTLCKTGHNFYSYTNGKQWNTEYAPVPSNYYIMDHIPFYIDFDLILIHTTDRFEIAYDLKQHLNIPILRHTHTLPHDRHEKTYHLSISPHVDMDTFISKYSLTEWGYEEQHMYHNQRADVIKHGIDTDFWKPQDIEREKHCLSVVNFWADRDWACGWSLWNEVKKDLPVKVLGNNPGLSKPAPSLEALRDAYASSQVFLNTSLHSPVPMSLMEAMACGCAVVSTDNCMIPELIISGQHGLLSNEAGVLNTYCKYLLNDPDMVKSYGETARNKILSEYGIDQFINTWNSAFERVLYK
jgi:glycosyltransferase involved in cell wall biosynthesis